MVNKQASKQAGREAGREASKQTGDLPRVRTNQRSPESIAGLNKHPTTLSLMITNKRMHIRGNERQSWMESGKAIAAYNVAAFSAEELNPREH